MKNDNNTCLKAPIQNFHNQYTSLRLEVHYYSLERYLDFVGKRHLYIEHGTNCGLEWIEHKLDHL